MKLINQLPSDAAYLYHYTSADTALKHILKNGTLQLNSFSRVNDPRESKEWDMSPFVRAGVNLSIEQYDAISRKISDMIKANAKLVCFSRDKGEAVGKCQPLDRGFAKPSMWHHYGDEHRGFCLMFDRNKLNEALIKQLDNGRLISGKVSYSNEGILSNPSNDPFVVNLLEARGTEDYISAIQDHLSSWFTDLFLRKLADWENEDEYRWIYIDNHSNPIHVNFHDSLEAIVIGEHVPDAHYEDILRYCVKYHAEVAKLNWHNGYPKIEHTGQPYITHRYLVDE